MSVTEVRAVLIYINGDECTFMTVRHAWPKSSVWTLEKFENKETLKSERLCLSVACTLCQGGERSKLYNVCNSIVFYLGHPSDRRWTGRSSTFGREFANGMRKEWECCTRCTYVRILIITLHDHSRCSKGRRAAMCVLLIMLKSFTGTRFDVTIIAGRVELTLAFPINVYEYQKSKSFTIYISP